MADWTLASSPYRTIFGTLAGSRVGLPPMASTHKQWPLRWKTFLPNLHTYLCPRLTCVVSRLNCVVSQLTCLVSRLTCVGSRLRCRSVGLCCALSGSAVLCRALSGSVALCRALSGSVDLSDYSLEIALYGKLKRALRGPILNMVYIY